MGEAPDIREQEDCPNGEVCDWACDQHLEAADGTTYPWAQDLDGNWHARPVDDEWGDPSGPVQAHGQCGAAFASVHVSTHRPIPEPDLDERLCRECGTSEAAR